MYGRGALSYASAPALSDDTRNNRPDLLHLLQSEQTVAPPTLPLLGERCLERARRYQPVDVRLARLPNAMDAADHLQLDCHVRLRLHDDDVRGRRQCETGRVALRREQQHLPQGEMREGFKWDGMQV